MNTTNETTSVAHEHPPSARKVWFITGASRGFGRIWTEAALHRGDRVAATARNPDALADLVNRYGNEVLPLPLDVTDVEQVRAAISQTASHFGRLDVVVNNAGYALLGAIEEADELEVRRQFDTNFFGALHVIQSALPLLRQQKSGHIIGVSSVYGLVAAPMTGYYNASKWAFEALHESLSKEVSQFGIKVTLLEPGAYATDFGSPSSLKVAKGIETYSDMRQELFAHGANIQFGEPTATAAALLKVVNAENPPLRLLLGSEGLAIVRRVYTDRLATWEAWEPVSRAAQGGPELND